MTTAASPSFPPLPFCTQADVEAALGRPLDPNIDVSFLMLTSSDLILGYLNTDVSGLPTPVPDGIKRVCAEMVANVLNRPQTPPDPTDTQYTVGSGFAFQVGPQSVGPWLTASQQNRLSIYRIIGWMNVEMISEVIGSDVSWDISTSFDPYAGTDLISQGGGGADTGSVLPPLQGS